MKSGKEILAEFQLDPWMLYDTIVNSTDDYIYLVNMQEDRALISENMLQDFDLPDLIVPGLIPLWGDLVHERDRQRFDDSEKLMSIMWNIRCAIVSMNISGLSAEDF